MKIRFPAATAFGEDGPVGPPVRHIGKPPQELVMKWETPQAIDLRFGMEITMYIAHR